MPTPTADWELRDMIISTRGSRSAALVAAGQPVVWTFEDELTSPWGAGTFGEATSKAAEAPTRLSLDFNLPPGLAERLAAIDEWAVGYLARHSERLLKKKLTRDQVQLGYKPLVKESKDPSYPPTLRTKFNAQGRSALRCWSRSGERVPTPADWRGVPCKCRVSLSHLWTMGPSFGWVVNLLDARVGEQEAANPFQDEERGEGDGSGGGVC